MLPSVRYQRLGALRCEESNGGLACAGFEDAADSCDRDAGDGAGQAGADGRGEEQFVVFAAMKSLGEGCCRVDGQQGRIDLGGDAGLLAEMSEVGREAVAQVEGGGGHAAALEPEALTDTRLRIEVRGEHRFQLVGDDGRVRPRLGLGQLGQAGESGGGSAESAGGVKQIAGSRAGAEQRAASGNSANEDDVGHDYGRFGQVSAGQRGIVGFCQSQKAVKKALDPGAPPTRSDGQLAR